MDERGNRTSYAYDALNRLSQTTNALGGLATVVYDAVGNVSALVDERGNRTTFTFDGMHRLVTTTNALAGVATLVYDLQAPKRGQRTFSLPPGALSRLPWFTCLPVLPDSRCGSPSLQTLEFYDGNEGPDPDAPPPVLDAYSAAAGQVLVEAA